MSSTEDRQEDDAQQVILLSSKDSRYFAEALKRQLDQLDISSLLFFSPHLYPLPSHFNWN